MRTKFSNKIIILSLMPLVLLAPLAMDIYVPSVPSMQIHLQSTAARVQWTLTIFMIGMAVGQFLMGPLVDRFGRRRVGLLSIGLYMLATLGCAIAPTVGVLIFSRLFQAIGACGSYIAIWAIVRDIIHEERQGQVYTTFSGLTGLAPIFAPLLGGYLVLWYASWRASFVFLVLYAFIMLCLVSVILPETLPKEKQLPLNWIGVLKRYQHIMQHSETMRYALCAGVGMSCLFSYFSVSPILLIQHLGVPEHHYGYYFGANGLFYALSCVLATQVQRKADNLSCVRIGAGLMFLGAMCMLCINAWVGLSLWGLVVPNFILAGGVGFILGPAMAGALRPFGHMAGTAASYMGVTQFLLAATIGASVASREITTAIPYAGAMAALSFVALIAVLSLRTRSATQSQV